MGPQTDGVEWVMATLFVGVMILAVVGGVRELMKARRGDPGGDNEERRR